MSICHGANKPVPNINDAINSIWLISTTFIIPASQIQYPAKSDKTRLPSIIVRNLNLLPYPQ